MADYVARVLEDYTEWNELVESSPHGTVFNKTYWLETIADTVGEDFEVVGVYKGERLVGGFGLNLFSLPVGKPIVATPRMTPYNGVVIRPRNTQKKSKLLSHRKRIVSELVGVVTDRYEAIELVHAPDVVDVRPFQWENWETDIRYTNVIDISNTDWLWDAVNGDVRTQVRKCRDGSVTVDRYEEGHADAFFDFFEKTFNRRDMVVPVGREQLRTMFRDLSSHGRLRVYVAQYEGSPVSITAIVTDEDGLAHEWQAATDPEHLSLGVAPFLRWNAIEDLAADGFTKFDMNGTGIESLANAKSQFAGQVVPHYVTRVQNPALRALRFGWDRLQDLETVQRLRRYAWQ